MTEINLLPNENMFRKHEHYTYRIPAAMLWALSNQKEIRIEVIVDCLTASPNEFLYVDLLADNGDKHAHLSIRPFESCLVINTMTQGEWGASRQTYVPILEMNRWRFELSVSRTGAIEVSFEGFPLLSFSTGLHPGAITSIASNTHARCVLENEGQSAEFFGAFNVSEHGSFKVALLEISSVDDVLPSICPFTLHGEVKSLDVRMQSDGNRRWWIYGLALADNPSTLQAHELEFTFAGKKNLVYETYSRPTVEVSWGELAYRTSKQKANAIGTWIVNPKTTPVDFRALVERQIQSDTLAIELIMAYTPISEFLRQVPDHGQATMSIAIRGATRDSFRGTVSDELYVACSETLFCLFEHNLHETDVGRFIILDMWSALAKSPVATELLQRYASLGPFLIDQGLSAQVDQLDPSPLSRATSIDPLVNELLIADLSQRIFNILASSEDDQDERRRQICDEIALHTSEVRHWALLDLGSHLLSSNFQSILESEIEEGYLAKWVSIEAGVWQRSSAFAILGATDQLERAQNLLHSISEGPLAGINLGAIASSLRLIVSEGIRFSRLRGLIYSLFRILTVLRDNGHSEYRHQGILEFLVTMFLESRFQPGWFQRDIIEFFRGVYFSVPEFWRVLRLQGSEDNSWDALLTLWEVATSAEQFHDLVVRLATSSGTDKWSDDSVNQLRTAGVNQGGVIGAFCELQLFMPVETEVLLENWESLFTKYEDTKLRLLAHPLSQQSGRQIEARNAIATRRVVRDRQGYRVASNQNIGEDLGRMLLDNSSHVALAAIQIIRGSDGADATESRLMALDVCAWCMDQGTISGQVALKILSEIISLLQNCDKLANVNPVLLSAATRVSNLKQVRSESKAFRYLHDELVRIMKVLDPSYISAPLPRPAFFGDTLVALYTCQKNLMTRARECIETWGRDVDALGVQVLQFCGSNDISSSAHFDDANGVVYLPVGDAYEDLPAKTLAMFKWIEENRRESFVLKIDDDCYLDAKNFFGTMAYRSAHYFGRPLTAFPETFIRTWHQEKVSSRSRKIAIDTSSTGSRYADGGGGYTLSRAAITTLNRAAASEVGIRHQIGQFYEDKLIGDLLNLDGIGVEETGYNSLQRRRTHSSARAVIQVDKTFYPSLLSGIALAHLDEVGLMRHIQVERSATRLRPARIWPFSESVSLRFQSNQLEVLNETVLVERLRDAMLICVCVIRNERSILPHFLEHYRRLGVELFLIIDNLSSDGSREFLLAEADIAVFSASSDYRNSHFGVDWQRTVLDHFCCGKWVVVADADEFLMPGVLNRGALRSHCDGLDAGGYDGSLTFMVDMYPTGTLSDVDFGRVSPMEAALGYDSVPVRPWPANRGPFGNFGSVVSSLRHRLMPLSSPNSFTAQKFALFRHSPFLAFSEGLHFASGLKIAPRPMALLHFKYSSDFAVRARREAARGQHFNGAEEYKAYLRLVESGCDSFWLDGVSRKLDPSDVHSVSDLLREVAVPLYY